MEHPPRHSPRHQPYRSERCRFPSMVAAHIQQQNDWNWHSEQPQQNSTSHVSTPNAGGRSIGLAAHQTLIAVTAHSELVGAPLSQYLSRLPQKCSRPSLVRLLIAPGTARAPLIPPAFSATSSSANADLRVNPWHAPLSRRRCLSDVGEFSHPTHHLPGPSSLMAILRISMTSRLVPTVRHA